MSNYEKIKKLCKEEGITITGLEKELGFSKGSLSKIDRNKPSIERITKLADRFHKPIGYFGKEGDDASKNSQKYYENEELAKEAQEMFEDKQMRSLPMPQEVYEAVRGSCVELPCLLAMWLSFTMSEIRGLTKSKSIDGDFITIREVLVTVGGVDERKEMAKEISRNRRHKMPVPIKALIDQVDGDIIVPMTQKAILYHLKKCMRSAGLPEISFHDLRHINASLMAMLRIPDKYAQERGGWKTDHVMKSVYMETFSEERQKVDKIIDKYFEEFV